jgi:hypothetical protein
MNACPRCQRPLVPGTTFCTHCGYNLKSTGPERPTPMERFWGFLHVNFAVGCVLFAILSVPVTSWLLAYVSGSITTAPGIDFSNPWLILGIAIAEFLSGLLWFTLFYLPRYLRMKVVRARGELLPLLPEGGKTFDAAFARVSRTGWPILIGIIALILSYLAAVLTPPSPTPSMITANGWLVDVAGLVGLPIFVVGFGTFFWVYVSCLRGLYALGRQRLILKPFYVDPTLGLRPMGALSLSLAAGYFALVALQAILSLLGGLLADIGLTIFLFALGLILFFLPLYSIHRTMLAARKQAQDTILARFGQHVASAGTKPAGDSEGTLAEVRDHLARLTDAFTVDMALREARAVRTWPFDTRILAGLGALILSLVTIIVAHIITAHFGL